MLLLLAPAGLGGERRTSRRGEVERDVENEEKLDPLELRLRLRRSGTRAPRRGLLPREPLRLRRRRSSRRRSSRAGPPNGRSRSLSRSRLRSGAPPCACAPRGSTLRFNSAVMFCNCTFLPSMTQARSKRFLRGRRNPTFPVPRWSLLRSALGVFR